MDIDLTSTNTEQDVVGSEAAPQLDSVPAPPVYNTAPAANPAELVNSVAVSANPVNTHDYPSLYDTKATTVLAILMGIAIVGGVQIGVARIFATAKTEHHALTHFVTAMVGLVLGVYVCDMLIAGPTTELLGEQERVTILAFIKDTCLMVFAYYFGTRAIPPSDSLGEQTPSKESNQGGENV